jgi:hypothetical protein
MIVNPSVGRFDGHEFWFPINDRLVLDKWVFVGAMKRSLPWAEVGRVPECRTVHLVASFVVNVSMFVKITTFGTITFCYGSIADVDLYLTGLIAGTQA